MPAQTKIKVRRGNTTAWSAGGTLDSGELGFDTVTGKLKVGDGTTAFASLVAKADTADSATGATNVNISTIDGNASDTTMYPVLVANASTGNQLPHVDSSGLAYNASTNNLTATGFTGNLTGNADTATAGAVYSTGTTTKTGNRRIFVGLSQPDATNAYGQGALQIGDIWIDV